MLSFSCFCCVSFLFTTLHQSMSILTSLSKIHNFFILFKIIWELLWHIRVTFLLRLSALSSPFVAGLFFQSVTQYSHARFYSILSSETLWNLKILYCISCLCTTLHCSALISTFPLTPTSFFRGLRKFLVAFSTRQGYSFIWSFGVMVAHRRNRICFC